MVKTNLYISRLYQHQKKPTRAKLKKLNKQRNPSLLKTKPTMKSLWLRRASTTQVADAKHSFKSEWKVAFSASSRGVPDLQFLEKYSPHFHTVHRHTQKWKTHKHESPCFLRKTPWNKTPLFNIKQSILLEVQVDRRNPYIYISHLYFHH